MKKKKVLIFEKTRRVKDNVSMRETIGFSISKEINGGK